MTTPLTSITPEGPVRGGVVVIQEAFGVTGHIVDVCRRFAAAGYHAVAPHLFHRSGDPVLEYDDMKSAMSAARSGTSSSRGTPFGCGEIAGPSQRSSTVISSLSITVSSGRIPTIFTR